MVPWSLKQNQRLLQFFLIPVPPNLVSHPCFLEAATLKWANASLIFASFSFFVAMGRAARRFGAQPAEGRVEKWPKKTQKKITAKLIPRLHRVIARILVFSHENASCRNIGILCYSNALS
jgi:hypothetical protein